jgi:hypothetical protein
MAVDAKYEVVSPLGERHIKWIDMAPRLDTIEDKTICELWNESFKSNITFPVIRDLLQKKYPGVKVVPYTDMPPHHMLENPGVTNTASDELIAALREKGCDAVISGNGG